MTDQYECPNCGESVVPTETVRCAEEIRFYSCPALGCDFSTWDPRDWIFVFDVTTYIPQS